MKIRLYQIAPEKDDKNLMFMSYEFTVLHGGINADSYELVFDGDLPAQTVEDVFRIFNLEHPNGYRGRSMSVSDIVWMEGIARIGIPKSWKYPIGVSDIVDADEWLSKNDISIGKESSNWHEQIDTYIDDLDGEDVLVSVDYHM